MTHVSVWHGKVKLGGSGDARDLFAVHFTSRVFRPPLKMLLQRLSARSRSLHWGPGPAPMTVVRDFWAAVACGVAGGRGANRARTYLRKALGVTALSMLGGDVVIVSLLSRQQTNQIEHTFRCLLGASLI